MLDVGIIGNGYVGTATTKLIGKNSRLFFVDPAKGQKDDVSKCDVVFICINETDATMTNLDKLVSNLVEENKQ
jgi:hypothetical protein